eukprot:7134974-Prymnesium_polylepis.1
MALQCITYNFVGADGEFRQSTKEEKNRPKTNRWTAVPAFKNPHGSWSTAQYMGPGPGAGAWRSQ